MRVSELVEALNGLDPDATISVFLDDEDRERGSGIFEPLVIPDDSDGWVAINIGKADIPKRRGDAIPDGYRLAFGIPYATTEWVRTRQYKVCPKCDLRIECIQRKDFESFSGIEYAVHYNAEHAADDGRILVDGEWFEPVKADLKPNRTPARPFRATGK